MATAELYCDVFDRLEREEVRYVVTGGVAVVLHGHVRPVADLDLVIDPAPAEAARVLRALVSGGFAPTLPLPLHMLTVMRMFDAARREVDVFARYSIAFDELWARSRRVGVGGGVARVVSLEHLLWTKQFDGRPRDLQDIAGLRAVASRVGAGEAERGAS